MTLASAHSNYHLYTSQNTIQNISVDQKTSQNTAQNNKLINPVNSVTDKSQAVNKVLGYGVDSEGYFTSDFNEAAGLPKDYRIHSKLFEVVEPLFTSKSLFNNKATHLSTDWAKTLGEYYRSSFQGSLKGEVFGAELSEEQYRDLFDDTRSWEELLKASDGMITNKGFALTKMFFEDDWLYSVKGETNLNGKLSGVDGNISDTEYQNFLNFMNANQFNDPTLPSSLNQHNIENGWSAHSGKMTLVFQEKHLNEIAGNDEELKELSKMISKIKNDYIELLNKDDLSLDEFKEEYLKIKTRHDEFVKQYEEKMGTSTQTTSTNSSTTTNTKESEEENKKSFTPIQVKSKTQTYTREEINKEFFFNFIENQKENSVNILEFLNKFLPKMQISNNAINYNTLANSSTSLPSKQEEKELDSVSKMMNKSLIELKRIHDELVKDIPILEDSLADRMQKGENIEHWIISQEMELEAQDQTGGLPIFDVSRWEEIQKDYAKALRTSKSIEEFKENYRQILDKHIGYFKETWAELDKALQEEPNATQSTNSINSNNTTNTEETDKKTFKPIKAKSSREIYKNTSEAKNLELTKTEQMKDLLEILFGQKAGLNSTLSNSALKEIFAFRKINIEA